MVAINDCFLLHSIIFRTLKRHFGGSHCYVGLVDLFLQTKMLTELGQLLDLITAPSGKPTNLLIFVPETYYQIVKHKTAYYSFYLPIFSTLIAVPSIRQDIYSC